MKKRVAITIDQDLLEKLKKVAKQENRNLSQEIEKTLKEKY
jgi:metal-responsive CopG/Arc/MetJ family transcriptional regulator